MGIQKVHYALGLTCLLTVFALPSAGQSAGAGVAASAGTAAANAAVAGYFVPISNVEGLQLLGLRANGDKASATGSSTAATPQTTAEALDEAVGSIEKYTAIIAKLRIQTANNVIAIFGTTTDTTARNRALEQVDRLVKLDFSDTGTATVTRTTVNFAPATTGTNAVPARLSVHYTVRVTPPNAPANSSPNTQPRAIPVTIRLQVGAGYVIRRAVLSDTWRTLREGF